MRFKRTVTLLSLATTLLGARAAAPSPLQLGPDGLGGFRIGMALADVNLRLKQAIVPTAVELRATANCDYNAVADLPGVAFLFIDDKLARIDVDSPRIPAMQGIHIGDSADAIGRKFPRARREPLDFVEGGFALVLEQTTGANAVSLQFEGNKLTHLLAGDKRAIRYAEGCL